MALDACQNNHVTASSDAKKPRQIEQDKKKVAERRVNVILS